MNPGCLVSIFSFIFLAMLGAQPGWVWGVSIFLGIAVFAGNLASNMESAKNAMEAREQAYQKIKEHLDPWKVDKDVGICTNKEESILGLFYAGINNIPVIKTIEMKSINDVELFVDGSLVTTGLGAALGGTGLGVMTASSKKSIDRIELRLRLASSNPVCDIVFKDAPDQNLELRMGMARKWYGIIKNNIEKTRPIASPGTGTNLAQSQQHVSSSQSSDSVDQLLKLADLREKGLLTEEEFSKQKAKIIS